MSGAQYDALQAESRSPAADAASAAAADAVLRTTFPNDHGILAGELAQERARLRRAGISPAAIAAAEHRGLRAAGREQATMSRLWAGVHYRFDNVAGTRLGRAVGELAVAAIDREAEPRPARSAVR